MLTGSSDSIVKLWDIRKISRAVHEFHGHQSNVVQVQWSPHDIALFATCSEDKRVIIWDIAKIGEEQTSEDAEDGPPELFFTHGGHTGQTSDICWNKNDKWTMASVAEDNILHIWKPSDAIRNQETLAQTVAKLSKKDVSLEK